MLLSRPIVGRTLMYFCVVLWLQDKLLSRLDDAKHITNDDDNEVEQYVNVIINLQGLTT